MSSEFEKDFWDNWYAAGGGSGAGSRGDLLKYKTDFMNKIFKEHDIKTVFDFGCGDGWQIKNLELDKYSGIDISKEAVDLCRKEIPNHWAVEVQKFEEAKPKHFDCCMCIDVLYHIMSDEVREATIKNIFKSKSKIIMLYTIPSEHIEKHGEVVGSITIYDIKDLIKKYKGDYKLIETTECQVGSGACFMVYKNE